MNEPSPSPARPSPADGLRAVLARVPVGIVAERRQGRSVWAGVLWRPVSVLPGSPSAAPWTALGRAGGEAALLYAGTADIELCRSETGGYRDNLRSGRPVLWVVLRMGPDGEPRPVLAVTADPATGEALTASGDDIVETVAMPDWVRDLVQAFVDAHHVEHEAFRRRRDDPAAARAGRGEPA
ncbi:DUF3305 domain-containing protein [Salinarimonas soli]|uniref:DUF3305 domain-containing protein n=1 Tax=Salinarimonas soli TaxID=1638099 RepID=A0A5B2VDY9_9HYPH|nr:DUF3305 domain-containing protein [Salinarimonas soli]KAA2236579.1 DUF3305 domain-containing protein [Salinarimonas soli]